MRQLSVIFFTILVLIGCSTDEQTMQLIEQAESVMIEHPDSALNIIRSVDAESIRGEEDMAHYRLAMAEAMYYNDSISVTHTQPLYNYYFSNDNRYQRARALYLHALTMWHDGEKARSMYSLMEAEKSLVNSRNYRLIGNIYLTKGEFYCNECLFDNSLESYYSALKHFELADLEYHITYTKLLVMR